MKFGLALPYNIADKIVTYAPMVEQAGWDGLFLGDAIWCEDPMITLSAAAVVTEKIRLGTMINPVPIRRPWKLASESIALDQISNGRLTLGLATGATWMGWYAFPDEVTDNRARAEMLDETIDILTLMYQREPFDYNGLHYHLKLSELDVMYYPPKPIQQPRIPIWIPGIWPREKSMRRVLKCDGMFLEVISPEGVPQTVTPDHLRQMRAYVEEHRTAKTPFDFVATGKVSDLDDGERAKVLRSWKKAGATWWVEGLWEGSTEEVEAVIKMGPG